MNGPDDLGKLFARAAEIASQVPPSMQEAAFHRALDVLQAEAGIVVHATAPPTPPKQHAPSRKPAPSRKTSPSRKPTSGEQDAYDVVSLFHDLSRDAATDVDLFETTIGKALAILRVANRELGVDGMTAPDVCRVLNEKFRYKIERRSIAKAFDALGRRVDRKRAGTTVVFRLMSEGDKWLDDPANQGPKAPGSSTQRVSRPATKASKSAASPAKAKPKRVAASTSSVKPSPNRAARTTGSTRSGPKGALEQLIATGYFDQPRTIGDIRASLEHDRAIRFKANELSPALVRLLRDGDLRRSKNAENQYEYAARTA